MRSKFVVEAKVKGELINPKWYKRDVKHNNQKNQHLDCFVFLRLSSSLGFVEINSRHFTHPYFHPNGYIQSECNPKANRQQKCLKYEPLSHLFTVRSANRAFEIAIGWSSQRSKEKQWNRIKTANEPRAHEYEKRPFRWNEVSQWKKNPTKLLHCNG